jgi:hypothetical protein
MIFIASSSGRVQRRQVARDRLTVPTAERAQAKPCRCNIALLRLSGDGLHDGFEIFLDHRFEQDAGFVARAAWASRRIATHSRLKRHVFFLCCCRQSFVGK